MFCGHCGSTLDTTLQFCTACGKPISSSSISTSPIVTTVPKKSGGDSTKLVVFVMALVLVCVAVNVLHPVAAFVSVLLIIAVSFGVYIKSIRPRKKLVLVGIALAAVLLVNGVEQLVDARQKANDAARAKQQAADRDEEARKKEQAFKQLNPAQHLEAARKLLVLEQPAQSISEGLRHVAAIQPTSPEASDAGRIEQQYKAAKKKQDEEDAKVRAAQAKKAAEVEALTNRLLRDAMAKSLENNLLDKGYNVDVVANGKDHTTLHVKWIFVSKAMAHQLSHEGDFFENARKIGFKRIEITDGYDETWYWNL